MAIATELPRLDGSKTRPHTIKIGSSAVDLGNCQRLGFLWAFSESTAVQFDCGGTRLYSDSYWPVHYSFPFFILLGGGLLWPQETN